MNGLAVITINEEQVTLKFGLPALRHVLDAGTRYNIMIDENHFNNLGLSHVLYGGYINDCMRKDVIAKREFSEFYDYVEDLPNEKIAELQSAIVAFGESRSVQDLVDNNKKKETAPTTENI